MAGSSLVVGVLSPVGLARLQEVKLACGKRRRLHSQTNRPVRASEGEGTVGQAVYAADEIMRLCQDGSYDGVVQYLADPYIRIQVEACEDSEKPLLYKYIRPDDQRGDMAGDDGNFPANSYAWRGVLFDPPDTWERTSVLQALADRCLIRYVVKPRLSDEEVVVTVDMRLEDALKPTYRSIQIAQQWFVHGLLGEPLHDDVTMYVTEGYTEKSHRRMGPETVVMCQLEDLKNRDVDAAWRWNTESCNHLKKCTNVKCEEYDNGWDGIRSAYRVSLDDGVG